MAKNLVRIIIRLESKKGHLKGRNSDHTDQKGHEEGQYGHQESYVCHQVGLSMPYNIDDVFLCVSSQPVDVVSEI